MATETSVHADSIAFTKGILLAHIIKSHSTAFTQSMASQMVPDLILDILDDAEDELSQDLLDEMLMGAADMTLMISEAQWSAVEKSIFSAYLSSGMDVKARFLRDWIVLLSMKGE